MIGRNFLATCSTCGHATSAKADEAVTVGSGKVVMTVILSGTHRTCGTRLSKRTRITVAQYTYLNSPEAVESMRKSMEARAQWYSPESRAKRREADLRRYEQRKSETTPANSEE